MASVFLDFCTCLGWSLVCGPCVAQGGRERSGLCSLSKAGLVIVAPGVPVLVLSPLPQILTPGSTALSEAGPGLGACGGCLDGLWVRMSPSTAHLLELPALSFFPQLLLPPGRRKGLLSTTEGRGHVLETCPANDSGLCGRAGREGGAQCVRCTGEGPGMLTSTTQPEQAGQAPGLVCNGAGTLVQSGSDPVQELVRAGHTAPSERRGRWLSQGGAQRGVRGSCRQTTRTCLWFLRGWSGLEAGRVEQG